MATALYMKRILRVIAFGLALSMAGTGDAKGPADAFGVTSVSAGQADWACVGQRRWETYRVSGVSWIRAWESGASTMFDWQCKDGDCSYGYMWLEDGCQCAEAIRQAALRIARPRVTLVFYSVDGDGAAEGMCIGGQ